MHIVPLQLYSKHLKSKYCDSYTPHNLFCAPKTAWHLPILTLKCIFLIHHFHFPSNKNMCRESGTMASFFEHVHLITQELLQAWTIVVSRGWHEILALFDVRSMQKENRSILLFFSGIFLPTESLCAWVLSLIFPGRVLGTSGKVLKNIIRKNRERRNTKQNKK